MILLYFAACAFVIAHSFYETDNRYLRVKSELESTFNRYLNRQERLYGKAFRDHNRQLIYVPYVNPVYTNDIGYMDQYDRATEDAEYTDPNKHLFTPKGFRRQIAHGVKDSLVGTVEGIAQVLTSPIETAEGLYRFGKNFVKDPASTVKAVGHMISQNTREQGLAHTASYAGTQVGMMFIPVAGGGKAASSGVEGASKMAQAAQVADSVGDIGTVAKYADTVSDVGSVARIVDTAGDVGSIARTADSVGDVGQLSRSASIVGEFGQGTEQLSRTAKAAQIIREGARLHAMNRVMAAMKDSGRIGVTLGVADNTAELHHIGKAHKKYIAEQQSKAQAYIEHEKLQQLMRKSGYDSSTLP